MNSLNPTKRFYQFKYTIPPLRVFCTTPTYRDRYNALKAVAPIAAEDEYIKFVGEDHAKHIGETEKDVNKYKEITAGFESINKLYKLKEKVLTQSIEEFVEEIGDGDCLDLLEKGIYPIYKDNIGLSVRCLYQVCRLVFICDKMPQDIGLTVENDWEIDIAKYITEHWLDPDKEEKEVDNLEKTFQTENDRRENVSKAKRVHTILQDIKTGEVIEFSSRKKCQDYLKMSDTAWSNFLKGISHKNKKYRLIENESDKEIE